MKKNIVFTIILLLLFLPLFMWLAWVFTPKTKFVAAIIDKTVLTKQGQEHISFNWILNYNRYTKTSIDPYEIDHDYFGFFPLEDEEYKLKGLERFTSKQLDQLSDDADMVYFTDTYGIYNNEWFQHTNLNERSGMLYGGLSDKDLELLALMKEKKKLIITEFNTIGSPTQSRNRTVFEETFALEWTGWTARYFDNLDLEVNKELPKWLIKNYKKAHNNQWPFKKSGIAFVNDKEQVVILEEDTHLTNPMPQIISTQFAQEHYGLPKEIKYSFWFDVMKPDTNVNQVISSFDIRANKEGIKELNKYGIPNNFPAITMHKDSDYSFFYFSGDFSDNPINYNSSYFKGIGYFKGMFYDEDDITERASFFWKYYRPLMNTILEEYIEE
ncbi:hypothetical protein [Gillisia sp. JM1]|uniref:hypothetical protein n=1 Tax=Gillisia sp. JM1 TaxID=1283286 RepID=UPI000551EFA4|nr:hypothetical protein [Gillisia sp. JM1]